jgi:hypothetical protein
MEMYYKMIILNFQNKKCQKEIILNEKASLIKDENHLQDD